jgi:hypothetical protein
LAPIYPGVDWTAAPPIVPDELFDGERELLADGATPFHAIVLAQPRSGFSKAVATARFAEPKIKRLAWEMTHRRP